MEELRTRLKIRLKKTGSDEDALLDEMLESARAVFLSARYPMGNAPDSGIESRWDDWLLRAAIEIYSKLGAEGQIAHSENGVSRTYESGGVSKSLLSEITPVAKVVRAK